MARRLHHLEFHVAKLDRVAVLHRNELELSLRPAAEVDRRPRTVAEFDVAGDEVGVEVREKHVLDRESTGLGVGEVLADVPLGIDHGRRPRLVVRDHVGGVREAGQVVLLDLHGTVSGRGRWGEKDPQGVGQGPTTVGNPARVRSG